MQIHDLTQQTPNLNSQLIFDTGSATYKALVSDIAKCIIEQYAGSTIGGTPQTLAAAISPNVTGRLGMLSNVNLDDMHTDATCGVYWLNCGDTGITGTKPAKSEQGLLLVKRQDSTYYRQVYISVTGTTVTSAFRWYKANTAQWDTWQTASLQTSLDNKLDLYTGTKIESNADLDTFTTPGTYFCVNTATAATLVNSPLSSVGFRLDVSRNGYNTDNYLVQTIQAVSTSTVFTYKRGMSVQGTWGAWYQTNEAPRQLSRITSLSDIPLGSNGYVQLDASVSPVGSTTSFTYWCTGVPTRRSIIVVYTVSSEAKAYVNVMHNDDGVTWKGWKSITLT